MKALAEQGVPLLELAQRYPVTIATIKDKSHKERWITPARINRGIAGKLDDNDPANAVAQLWKEREEQQRETIYNGASSALKRFFALSPVPQSFQEAAVAKKLVDEAIKPKDENASNNTLNLAILTQSSFKPQPVIVDEQWLTNCFSQT